MTYEYIPKLIRAALNNDRKNVEAIALLMGRKLRRKIRGYQKKLCVHLPVSTQVLV